MEDMSRIFYSVVTGSSLDDIDPRRRIEYINGQMINEDHSAVANLPSEPIHTKFNMNYPFDGSHFKWKGD